MLARVYPSSREERSRRWRKASSTPSRPSGQLESNLCLINVLTRGLISEDVDCSHYMKDFYAQPVPLRNPKAKALLAHIDNNYGTLAFCRKWVEESGFEKHLVPLKALVDAGVVNAYPPLSDIPGCYVA